MKKLLLFFTGVKKEVQRVRWPDRKHMVKYSLATLVTVVFLGAFFYAVDLLVVIVKMVLR